MNWRFIFIGSVIVVAGCGILKKTAEPVEGNVTIKEAFTTTRIAGDKNRKTRYTLSFFFEELSPEIQMDSVTYNNKTYALSQKTNQASAKINKVLYDSKDKVASAVIYFTKKDKVYFKKVLRIKNLEPLYMP